MGNRLLGAEILCSLLDWLALSSRTNVRLYKLCRLALLAAVFFYCHLTAVRFREVLEIKVRQGKSSFESLDAIQSIPSPSSQLP